MVLKGCLRQFMKTAHVIPQWPKRRSPQQKQMLVWRGFRVGSGRVNNIA